MNRCVYTITIQYTVQLQRVLIYNSVFMIAIRYTVQLIKDSDLPLYAYMIAIHCTVQFQRILIYRKRCNEK